MKRSLLLMVLCLSSGALSCRTQGFSSRPEPTTPSPGSDDSNDARQESEDRDRQDPPFDQSQADKRNDYQRQTSATKKDFIGVWRAELGVTSQYVEYHFHLDALIKLYQNSSCKFIMLYWAKPQSTGVNADYVTSMRENSCSNSEWTTGSLTFNFSDIRDDSSQSYFHQSTGQGQLKFIFQKDETPRLYSDKQSDILIIPDYKTKFPEHWSSWN